MGIAIVIFWLFAGVGILYVVHYVLYLVHANFDDVWHQRLKGTRCYIMDLQLPARRCIARSRGLFRRREINTWKSPRAGGVVVVARAE